MAQDDQERAALLAHQGRGYGATAAGSTTEAEADEADAGAPAPAPPPRVEAQAKPFREIWTVFLGLATAVFCAALSATIVANIQIDIASYFRAGSLSSWLGTAFLLGLTAMTPLYGRLAQVLGRKGAMLLALFLFTTGSILCAIAPSMYFVLGARAIAGAGSGGLLTVTAIIITDLVSTADRGLYQGGVNVLFGAGSATGAVLGGWVADRFGWRAAFWMTVPPTLLATVLIVWKVNVPRPKSDLTAWQRFTKIDWLGSALLIACISALTTASSLYTSSGYAFSHPLALGLLATAALAAPLFALVETRVAEPIMPLGVLLRGQVGLVLVAFVFNQATGFSRLYFQPVYLHVVRGLDGSTTGLLLVPSSIAGSAASLYAGWHMRHYKEYKWFQVVASCVPWLQTLSLLFGWGLDTSVHRLWAEMAVGSIGGGALITSLLTSLVASVDPAHASLAISACYLSRALGQVLGVSLSAATQQLVLGSALRARIPDDPGVVRALIDEPARFLPTLDAATQRAARAAYLASVDAVFALCVAGGVVLTGLCIAVRAQKL
ncbi:hypothetical protein Q5752_004187 [Cryptotrichosporon argae]